MASGVVGTIEDTQGLKNVSSEIAPIFKLLSENIQVQQQSTVVTSTSITNNTLIFGSSSKTWGSTYPYGTTIISSFVLSSATTGILGSTPLGDGRPLPVVLNVSSPSNVFRESLRDTLFLDSTNTTATWDTVNYRFTFTGSDKIQTLAISKNATVNITTATLRINSGQITNPANLSYYLSNDGGTTWESVTLNTRHTFTTSVGTELRLKIECAPSVTAQIDIDDADENSFPLEVLVNQ